MKQQKMKQKILLEASSKPKWVKCFNIVVTIILIILILGTMYKYNRYILSHENIIYENSNNQHKVLAEEILGKTVKTFFILLSYVVMFIAIGLKQMTNLFLN